MWNFNAADYISLFAFAIAIWQINRAGRWAKAAKTTIDAASMRAGIYNLLLLAPQFEKCEAQIESAALSGNPTQLLDRMREWRKIVAQLKGLLSENHQNRTEIEASLDDSLRKAGIAKTAATKAGADLVSQTERFRAAASHATSMVVTLASQVSTNLSSTEDRVASLRKTDGWLKKRLIKWLER